MITAAGIAGWCAVAFLLGVAFTLSVIAYWDRRVDLGQIEAETVPVRDEVTV